MVQLFIHNYIIPFFFLIFNGLCGIALKLFPYKHSLLLYEASETSLTSPYQTSCCSYDTCSIAHTILNIPQTACSHLRSLPLQYLGRYCQKKSVDTSSTDFFYFIVHFRKKAWFELTIKCGNELFCLNKLRIRLMSFVLKIEVTAKPPPSLQHQ